MFVIWIIIIMILNTPVISCSSLHGLHKELFESRNYTKWVAPIKSDSEPLTILMTYDLVGISKFDAMSGQFVARALLSFKWSDSSLSWLPEQYGGITSFLYPIEKVWYPPVLSVSSYNSSKLVCGTGAELRIWYTGMLYWLCGNQFQETCSPDVELFPFDVQRCNSVFAVWGYTESQVRVTYDPTTLYSGSVDNGQWKRKTVTNANGNTYGYSSLTFSVEFQRKSTYAVLFAIIPIFVFGFLNLLVFLVEHDTGQKLSYSMTVLLANALFLVIVAESLPKVSKPIPNICIMLIANFATSVVTCSLSVLTVHLYYVEPKNAKANGLIRRISMYMEKKIHVGADEKTTIWKKASAKIDATCFVVCAVWILVADSIFLMSVTFRDDIFEL